ncbi:hypothetical protein GCM10011344_27290 [Dokdonia pacifica]|uniref:Uncharacterized protein n=1 Tax=Dokdonia pacifica TaxID=1627892 RepID=A0A239E5G6_9FLAO|nr:hypothetical protein [Dokdonia pacifica]GGG25152.1 hypothetical protein GCM10011344_27290 [Dokdonia pacifica]SNS39916.1 hypothetical protein SAMN06265376_11415 [Dokdonia pacifica]
MVGLKKKIPASTLMETLVATSIILIVFVVASLVLMNTFKSVAERDTFSVQNRLEKLQYLIKHEKITLPYDETYDTYEISIVAIQEDVEYIIYSAKKTAQSKPLVIKQVR